MSETEFNWEVFKGDHTQDGDRIKQLPPPPPWRQFYVPPVIDLDDPKAEEKAKEIEAYEAQIHRYWEQVLEKGTAHVQARDRRRGKKFRIRSEETKQVDQVEDAESTVPPREQNRVVEAVNAALSLRRPLLITGRPGSGKTSLAYAIAYELCLGPVLMWPITARTTLEKGLYRYDAIARLQEAQLRKHEEPDPKTNTTGKAAAVRKTKRTIGDYIQLGPLGTAFVPTPYPRVLLIDEIDKSDINLPNDLLNLLEEGQFEIPELVRLDQYQSDEDPEGEDQLSTQDIKVRTADEIKVSVPGGKLRCHAFPLIIMTSNGERDFPPAFLRRCLRLEMPNPEEEDLYEIVKSHLEEDVADQIDDLITYFLQRTNQEAAVLATDQLLNAAYLRKYKADLGKDSELRKLILSALTSSGGR